MHELGLAQIVVDRACEQAGTARVRKVTLEIGVLAVVLPDALRFCFDIVTRDTRAEGAILDIIEVPGQARCRVCGGEVELYRPFGRCSCGSSDLDWLRGDELRIQSLEVD